MSEPNRWAKDDYPDYRKDVNEAISFSPVNMDYFLFGKAEAALELIGKHAAPVESAVVLDLGCGIGAMHPALVDKVARLDGVDVSPDAVQTAATANPQVRYQVYDGRRLPHADNSFDAALTVCVMHHIPPEQREAFVAEAWRVVRPGGIFAVFEHNPLNPLTRLAVMRCPFDHDAVLLWPGETRKLLQRQGFVIVESPFLFFVPLRKPWAKKIDRALSWLPAGAQYAVCGRKP